MSDGVRIVRLEAENVKRLTAIDITPDGNMIVIGGKNGSGKSSTLDAIWYALGGTKAIPDKPVRDGAESATITLKLSNGLIVKKEIAKNRTVKLTVTNADGFKAPQPQAILDALIGHLTFDPLAFVTMPPQKQIEVLKSLVGLDFAQIDATRRQTYDERTDLGRTLKALESRLAVMAHHPDAPKAEVSIGALSVELDAAHKLRAQAADLQRMQDAEIARQDTATKAIAEAEENIRLWEAHKKASLKTVEAAQQSLVVLAKQTAALPVPDLAEIQQRLSEADGLNAKVRLNKARVEAITELAKVKLQWDTYTSELEAIDADKQAQLADAKFPIEGLSFSAEAVLYNGHPLPQAGMAEKIRVSTAMGFALNPEFKVARIYDGSLLDEDNLKVVAEMAAEHGAQVWIERVGSGEEVSVVIENGEVKETRAVKDGDSND